MYSGMVFRIPEYEVESRNTIPGYKARLHVYRNGIPAWNTKLSPKVFRVRGYMYSGMVFRIPE
ncbi:MAG: hypothetical protein IPK76_04225 [Lewinellaceae bacterium]|nr:hypothetical protein [Lewinellaceae bacterium]